MQGLHHQDASEVIFKKARLYLKTRETKNCLHRNLLNQQNSDFVFRSVYGLPKKNLGCLLANIFAKSNLHI